MFLFSCCLMLTIPPLRIFCLTELDDHVCVVIMLTTAPYFLFFCRYFSDAILPIHSIDLPADTIFQRFQNRGSVRGDDLSHGHG